MGPYMIRSYKKQKNIDLNIKLARSIQQAKEGKVRTVSSEELDQWEKDLG